MTSYELKTTVPTDICPAPPVASFRDPSLAKTALDRYIQSVRDHRGVATIAPQGGYHVVPYDADRKALCDPSTPYCAYIAIHGTGGSHILPYPLSEK